MYVHHYVRCSDSRSDKGDTKERQTESAQLSCKRRSMIFRPEAKIVDIGTSALHGANLEPGSPLGDFFQKALDGKLPPNSVLIFDAVSRYSRVGVDIEGKLWDVINAGLDIYFYNSDIYLSKGLPDNAVNKTRLIWELEQAGRESMEKKRMVDRDLFKKCKAADEGKKVNFSSHAGPWVVWDEDIQDYKLNKGAEYVRTMWREKMAGTSLADIARILNGYSHGWRGGRWDATTILNTLRNRKLIGELSITTNPLQDDVGIPHVYPNYLPPILTLPEWDALQARLAADSIVNGKHGGIGPKQQVFNLFSSMITCAYCKGRVRIRSGNNSRTPGTVYAYYWCQNNNANQGCTCSDTIRADALELHFFGSYLKTSPAGLLTRRDEAALAKQEANRLKLDEYNRMVAMYVDMIEKPQNEAIRVELTTKANNYAALRTILIKEIDRLTEQTQQVTAAGGALKSLQGLIRGTDASAAAAPAVELAEQLAEQTNRHQIRDLMPQIIRGIVIDLTKKEYAVESLAGVVGESMSLDTIVKEMNRQAVDRQIALLRANPPTSEDLRWKPETRMKMKAAVERRRKLGIKNKFSEEGKAKMRAARQRDRQARLAKWATDRGLSMDGIDLAWKAEDAAMTNAEWKADKDARKAGKTRVEVMTARFWARLGVQADAMRLTPEALAERMASDRGMTVAELVAHKASRKVARTSSTSSALE